MGITRTRTVADAWANDDGGVTIEVDGSAVAVTVVEAAEYASTVMNAAWEAAQSNAEKDGFLAVEQMRERMAESRSDLDGVL